MKILTIAFPEENVCQMVFSVAGEEFSNAMAKMSTVQKNGKTLVGQELWYETINRLMEEQAPALYHAAVEEHKLEPVTLPDYHLLQLSEEGFTAEAVVSLRPKLRLGTYRGLTAVCQCTQVTEKDIDTALEQLRSRHKKLVEKNRSVQQGDTIELDYYGTVEGKPFWHSTGANQTLTVGGGTMLSGFEEALVGHMAGECFTMELKLPSVFHVASDLAGKTAQYEIKLQKVGTAELPELGEAFAKELHAASMQELREKVKAKLAKEKQDAAMESAKKKMLEQLAEHARGELPQPMVEREYNHMMKELELSIQLQHTSMEAVLERNQMTRKELEKQMRRQADRQCRGELALLEVAEKEHLEPDEAEWQAEIARRAEQHKKTPEAFMQTVDPMLMRHSYLRQKAAAWVLEHGAIQEIVIC